MLPHKQTVSIITKAYNTKAFVEQCVGSVLSQSYSDFEYILIDNGCTDGTSDILNEYAQSDERIRLIRFNKNRTIGVFAIARELARGEYVSILDSDDWIEPDFLSQLLNMAEKNRADIVCTGTLFHYVATEATGERSISEPIIINEEREFAEYFPYYHAFFRSHWAKLFRMSTLRNTNFSTENPESALYKLNYGGDTANTFSVLRKAKTVCIDNSILYHYRVHNKSVSHIYDPLRSQSDALLHSDALSFLSAYGPISEQNRRFLAAVYANAVNDTAHVIYNADIPEADKLREYRRIAEHPVTKENFVYDLPDVHRSEKELIAGALSCRSASNAMEEMPAILNVLAPKCAAAFSMDSISLLNAKPALLEPLINDDPEATLKILLEMLRTNDQSKKFDLCAMVAALSADRPLLKDCCDKKFLRRYGSIYLAVWRGQHIEALDAMAGLLLDGEKVDETFLQLYLSLAALQNQPEAFTVGKIKLAEYYLQKNDLGNCRSTLLELDEMGVGESPLVLQIKAKLR